jgi:hypothetical protein
MSSIAEGLSIGGEHAEKGEGDISTNEDFMASLSADLGLAGDEPPAPPTPPAPDGTSEDDDGDNSEADTGDEELTAEQKELKELRALYGRQSNELGELRKLVAQPKDEEEEADTEAFTIAAPITEDVLAEIEQAIDSNGGEQVAVWALTNRPDLYETVLDTWADQGGAAARRSAQFDMRYQTALQAEIASQEQSELTEFQKGLANDLDTQVSEIAPEYGLTPGVPETDQLLADVIAEAPASIQKLVVSRDAKEREDGLRVVLALAAAKTATTASSEEDKAAAEARKAALEQAKKDAAVGGGSLRPAPPAQEGGAEQPDFLDAFQKALLETPSTSVADGLSYGGKSAA